MAAPSIVLLITCRCPSWSLPFDLGVHGAARRGLQPFRAAEAAMLLVVKIDVGALAAKKLRMRAFCGAD